MELWLLASLIFRSVGVRTDWYGTVPENTNVGVRVCIELRTTMFMILSIDLWKKTGMGSLVLFIYFFFIKKRSWPACKTASQRRTRGCLLDLSLLQALQDSPHGDAWQWCLSDWHVIRRWRWSPYRLWLMSRLTWQCQGVLWPGILLVYTKKLLQACRL